MVPRWLSRGSGRKSGPGLAMVPSGAPSPASLSDPRDVVLVMARRALAPPLLDGLADGTMVVVAPVPGKRPEEWQDEGARPFWIAWPDAEGADVCAEVMTAGQLRALLAARDNS